MSKPDIHHISFTMSFTGEGAEALCERVRHFFTILGNDKYDKVHTQSRGFNHYIESKNDYSQGVGQESTNLA